MGFIEGFKQGLNGVPDPTHFEVAGRQVACPHCGGRDFDLGSALLNTAGLTFLGLDWANRQGYVLICRQCGRVEWFLREPTGIA